MTKYSAILKQANNRKQKRLYESRDRSRELMEPIGQMQVLGNEHDLGKGQRVDQRESVERVINVMIGEDHGPMKRAGRTQQHNKEIKRENQVLSHLVADFCFERWWAWLMVASPQAFRSSSNSSAHGSRLEEKRSGY